ncbi:hypothetical protein [Treponema sp.]|uniref:hypothetical protein n=1 Tax=Treponema sp. TaxID=166 RepID=UPI0025F9A3C6|nr:hypothetical protein [Treponema sp.]MCR5217506.1 hypothetical protein [Treponema sp.]
MKKFLVFILSIFISAEVFAQMSVNPQHEFYSYAQGWYLKGYVESLPPLRPYPVSKIKEILTSVLEKTEDEGVTDDDFLIASRLYEELTGKSFHVVMESDFTVTRDITDDGNEELDSDTNKLLCIYPSVQGDLTFKSDFVSMGYKLGFAARNAKDESDFLPAYTHSEHDSIQDPASVGPANVYLDVDDVISIGYNNLYLQAGIYRSGYGTFIGQGLALNDSTYHAGNLSFTYMGDLFTYAQQISVIGATTSYNGDNLSPNKVLAFHQISFKPFSFLEVAYYESIVYGKRFDLSYALPVPYMVAQGVGGCSDNLQMGLKFDVRPYKELLWTTDIYVDDFSVNDIVKLNIDAKYRIAFQTGLLYTPSNSFCDNLSLNYTLITPYTYSHWQYDSDSVASISAGTVNYQDYTNSGIQMGANIPPNSDAINMSITFSPLKSRNLSFVLHTNYIRHGNVSESLTDEEALRYLLADAGVYATDGSANQHSMYETSSGKSSGDHVDTAWNALNYLSQDHQMYIIQCGADAEYKFPVSKKGRSLSLKVGYMFEYTHNYGVDENMYPGGLVTESSDGVYEYDGKTYSDADGSYDGSVSDLVNIFKDAWEDNLVNRLCNYVTVGFCYRF